MGRRASNANRVPQRNFVRRDVVSEVDEITQANDITKQTVMEQGMQLWLKLFKSKGMVGVLEQLDGNNV